MKPSLQRATLVAVQRLVGTLIGAAAALLLLIPAVNTGAIAAGVLLLVDLPQPANYAAEGYRLLWTLCGVGIGVLVMLLAGLLAKRAPAA
jgi:hypothetical protein